MMREEEKTITEEEYYLDKYNKEGWTKWDGDKMAEFLLVWKLARAEKLKRELKEQARQREIDAHHREEFELGLL